MIEHQTVFVLGAGAHCSYGFPSGEELKEQVARLVANSLSPHSQVHSFLSMPAIGVGNPQDVQPEVCRAFAEALREAGQPSIDAFLNANRKMNGFEIIGKGAIAQILIEKESSAHAASDDDWITYFFRIMADGISKPDELVDRNRVSFVTFNYDRLLEIRLFRLIKHSYGCSNEEALSHLQKIPIHHVYGMLGDFPIPQLNQHSWIHASKGLRTIYDAGHEASVIAEVKKRLQVAERICLLGFGFHRENIEIIDLVTASAPTSYSKTVACSRYQLTEAEWTRYTRSFTERRVEFHAAHFAHKCKEALRNLPIF